MSVTTTRPSSQGSYRLAAYPDCTKLHSTGPYAGRSIYVVARGTDQERLFRKDKLVEAAAYAREIRSSSLENVPTSALCDEAVLAVYAGS